MMKTKTSSLGIVALALMVFLCSDFTIQGTEAGFICNQTTGEPKECPTGEVCGKFLTAGTTMCTKSDACGTDCDVCKDAECKNDDGDGVVVEGGLKCHVGPKGSTKEMICPKIIKAGGLNKTLTDLGCGKIVPKSGDPVYTCTQKSKCNQKKKGELPCYFCNKELCNGSHKSAQGFGPSVMMMVMVVAVTLLSSIVIVGS